MYSIKIAKKIIIDFYRKLILIEVTTFFFADFYPKTLEIDIHRCLINGLLSINYVCLTNNYQHC